ncbi:MAG: right-handed parallel beta-helix repeat-containing protein, partial [Deltaproteobacteria bacterium]|nr:right-handed parallel beta-helix repeat-containing protein [Deltaproteobacteria bacterium]
MIREADFFRKVKNESRNSLSDALSHNCLHARKEEFGKNSFLCQLFAAVSILMMLFVLPCSQAMAYITHEGETISSDTTWHMNETHFIGSDGLSVASGVTLTIEEGVFVKFWGNFNVYGNLKADGSSENPIYFTSQNDNRVGEMIAGSTGSPSAGDWDGVYVSGATGFGNFNYCVFRYGGNFTEGYDGAVSTFNNASVYIYDSEIAHNETGLGVYNNASAYIEGCKVHHNNVGIVVGNAAAWVYDNAVEFNTSYGISITGSGDVADIEGNDIKHNSNGIYSGTTINAQFNYWGAPDGPYGGSYTGSGDNVSAFVDCDNWLSKPIYDATPAINLHESWGVVTRTEPSGGDFPTSLEFDVEVVDLDGFFSDGSGHTVTVTFPSGTSVPLQFGHLRNMNTAQYFTSISSVSSIQPGAYTFTAKDSDGHTATAVDVYSGVILNPPDEGSFLPSGTTLANTTPTISWDPVTGVTVYEIHIYDMTYGYPGYWIWNEDFSGTTYTVPPGVLAANTQYGYQILAKDSHMPLDSDNISSSPASSSAPIQFWTGVTTVTPYIESDEVGVLMLTEKWGTSLAFNVEVFDAAGVPDNIRSVIVTHTSGVTEHLYYTGGDSDEHKGMGGTSIGGEYFRKAYEPWVDGGTYAITVTNWSGATYETTEELTYNPIPLTVPRIPFHDPLSGLTDIYIEWDDIGAAIYEIEIYDQYHNDILWSATTGTSITIAQGFLEKNRVYHYELWAFREFEEQNIDNAIFPSMFSFLSSAISGVTNNPSISLNDYGAAVYKFKSPGGSGVSYALIMGVDVSDPDGLPQDIKSVIATHVGSGTTYALDLEEISSGETEASYLGMDILSSLTDVPDGIFSFEVTDFGGNSSSVTDDLVLNPIDIPQNSFPLIDSFVAGTTPTISWDTVSGASSYKVQIVEMWDDYIFSSSTTGNSVNIPPDLLKMNWPYGFEVLAYRELSPDDIDNISSTSMDFSDLHHFTTVPIAPMSSGTYYVNSKKGSNSPSNGTLPGNGAWKTLHYAIDKINSGVSGPYILNVAPGTYDVAHEGDSQLSITQDNVLIQGASGASRPVIDGTGGDGWYAGIEIIDSSGVTIQDLQIQNFWESGIYILDCSPLIQRNILHENGYGIDISIYFTEFSSYIGNNLITSSIYDGIYISGYVYTSFSEILHNTIDGSGYNGIYLDDNDGSFDPTIAGNIITNSGDYGIYNYGSIPSIFYNDVWNSNVADYYG